MITIIAVGKRHEPWLADGIARYEQRMTRALSLIHISEPTRPY